MFLRKIKWKIVELRVYVIRSFFQMIIFILFLNFTFKFWFNLILFTNELDR